MKGPVPWEWLANAAKLPGRALVVGLVLWLWAGMKKGPTVRLSCRQFPVSGISRFVIYRALVALERAELVTVRRRRGHAPLVTIIQVGDKEKDATTRDEEHDRCAP